ncbi:hypothetical protein CDL12_10615 [Handroanthus impetiginosus]|uniref:F-box associated beta-propeller type 3 domain-containing protein n=1 Tax=Handroanthus impetiginosus TaxID=429701 RepID=A0A2G9HHG6_9LAMI|nr:hypothetical protein CDL12_10615 [Handroanthus impetiginosus]
MYTGHCICCYSIELLMQRVEIFGSISQFIHLILWVGLVCIFIKGKEFLLWNPSTKESKKLASFDGSDYIIEDGFGYIIENRFLVKSLLRFKSICQSWHSLISDEHFIKTHLKTSKKNPTFAHLRILPMTLEQYNYKAQHCSLHSLFFEPFTSASRGNIPVDESVNSLNLVGSCNGIDYLLWNPSTREFKELPDFDAKMSCGYIIGDGFGFDPSSGDYKVYAALYCKHQAIAKTYSLKTMSWRINNFHDCNLFDNTEKFVSRRLQWKFNKKEVWGRRWYISSFDLKNEVYGMVEQPRVFEFDPDLTLGSHNGDVLFKYGTYLFVYNPKKNCIWYPKMIGFNILGEVDVYVESLVSINVANVEE